MPSHVIKLDSWTNCVKNKIWIPSHTSHAQEIITWASTNIKDGNKESIPRVDNILKRWDIVDKIWFHKLYKPTKFLKVTVSQKKYIGAVKIKSKSLTPLS